MNSFVKKIVAIAFACLTVSVGLPEINAQQVGDRVVVTANFETKIYNKKVDQVFGGDIRTVVQIEGDWSALNDIKGWVPSRNLMSLETAVEHYDELIQDDKKNFLALAHRGMIHFENEEYVKAFTDLNASLRINPRNPVTWNNRGIVLQAQGKYELAFKDITYAIKLNPKYVQAHYNQGLVLHALGNNKEAIASFDNAIELDKNNPWFLLSRGSARLAIGDLKGADGDYDAALAINKKMADGYVGKSNVALGRDDVQTAFKMAQKAIDAQPKNAMGLNARGWINYRLGRLDDALSDFNQSIQYAPSLPIVYNNRGVVFAAKQEFESAIKDYSKSIELAGGVSPVAVANRGTAWFGNGDFEKAQADFVRAQKEAPNLDDALNAFAWFQATCPDEEYRDGKSAVDLAQKACELSKWKNWNFIDTLGAAYAESGDFEKAIEFATKALESAPESGHEEIKERIASYNQKQPIRGTAGKNAGRR